jgi:hypothetical protein
VLSNLLPRAPEVATRYADPSSYKGSNLPLWGSRNVAGWVAGCLSTFWLTRADFPVKGSKGSNFSKNYARERKL